MYTKMAVSLSDSPPSQGPSCPVCFRDYSDNENDLIPRILQCGHTYCTGINYFEKKDLCTTAVYFDLMHISK